MLLGYGPLDLLLALGAGFACGFLNTAASSGSVVTLPIMIFLGLDAATANATNRLPVLVGALSGASDFARRKAMPWRLAFRIAVPTTIGSLIGAVIAEIVPRRDMGMVVTAAVLFAALLLFKNIKKAIEQAQQQDVHLGLRELALFVGAGVWLGFIVLGGATCMVFVLLVVAISAELLQLIWHYVFKIV